MSLLGFGAIGSYALGTVPSSGPTNTILTAVTGTYAVSGQAALFKVTQLSSVGAFAETGVAALFKVSELASVGSFAETGNAATFKTNFASSAGSYTVSGVAAVTSLNFPVGAGSYLVTVNDASFVSRARRPLYIRGVSYWKGVQ